MGQIGWRSSEGIFTAHPPTLIWPADRAWFVAGDVDLDSTYVGGSHDLIAAILAEPDLEAWPVDLADSVVVGSDTLNQSSCPSVQTGLAQPCAHGAIEDRSWRSGFKRRAIPRR